MRLRNSAFYHTMYFYLCVPYESQNKVIIFIYSVDKLISITEMQVVHSAVRVASISIMQFIFRLQRAKYALVL